LLQEVRAMLRVCAVGAGVLAIGCGVAQGAMSEEVREQGLACAQRAIDFLKAQQDPASGGWSLPEDAAAPQLPAISALALTGIVMDERIGADDPTVQRGVDYLLSFRKDDGGIHDGILPAYNTSLSISALTRVEREAAKDAIPGAVSFLKGLQWGEDSSDHPSTGVVPKSHPFYGGVGYGGNSRPDNSNLNLMLEALHDAGVEGDDPAFQRALTFLQRTQMLDEVNDMPYADGSKQGGFIYATGPDSDHIGEGESKAGMIDEALIDGTTVSRLRAYGSITYAGFKSYLYADLEQSDPRVVAAMGWIGENYTLEENPGVGTDGYYYYLVTFAKALHAAGIDEVETETTLEGRWDTPSLRGEVPRVGAPSRFVPDDATIAPIQTGVEVSSTTTGGRCSIGGVLSDGREFGGMYAAHARHGEVGRGTITITDRRDWRADLIAKLVELQEEDGSFRSVGDRWMEGNEVLVTAYGLIALEHALERAEEEEK
jgi:squalene-hopene/tetraprenyl-beta-curcumene cyclase